MVAPGNPPLDRRLKESTLVPFFSTSVRDRSGDVAKWRSLLPTMNRLNKLFFYVYPGVLSAPTAVQYYDLAKIERPALPEKAGASPVTSGKNKDNEWAQTVIRLAQKPWWRKAERPDVAA